MKVHFNMRARALAGVAVLSLLLAACGGGGGDGGTTTTTTPTTGGDTTPPAATSLNFSGVAARGAAMAGAAIVFYDATGTQIGTATADGDGKYTITLPLASKAPFVVSAAKGDTTYYAPVAEAKSGTVNVTKLTNLIAAQLSPTGDPAALATQVAGGAATVSAATVKQVVNAIEQALQPLLQNVGDATDPISGTFTADGTGHDRLLMALDIVISPSGASSNISITVKMAVSGDNQPQHVEFTSGSTPPALPASVATATLPASDTDTLVADFMSRMQACYNLPRTTRVTGTTADSVSAPGCRQLFLDDDPTEFLNNGARVGPNGAFPGLFKDGATGVVFSDAVIQFLSADGKVLIGWKNTGSGGVSYSQVWLQRQNGAFKAVGNNYQYSFIVRAWSEWRNYLNRPEMSYWATGFEVNLPNATSGGVPVFDHVVVTAPNGATITMVPVSGLSYLSVQGTSGTSVVRLAGKFTNTATAGVPRRLTGVTNGESLAWAPNPDTTNTDWTDAQIIAINNVGSWKAEFYLASNPSAVAATQYYQTLTRPLTVTELSARQWAMLTAAAQADAIANSSANGAVALGEGDTIQLDEPGTPPDFWTVPTGALPPTLIQAQGYVANAGSPAPRWNDSTSIASTARTVVINCSAQTNADPHCGTASGTYSANARLNLLQMFAYDAKNTEWVSNFVLGLLKGIN